MTKRKLERFEEMKNFPNVLQPSFEEVFQKDYFLKGKWHTEIFKNNNPIILELGCGKGEYTIELAKRFPQKNFIGIDIKGARMWRGAKTALECNLKNVIFLRTRIDFINSIFNSNEVDEIWLTFPDPQPKKVRKRLTSSRFLNMYQKFLKNPAIIHLKTDNDLLFQYTCDLVKFNDLKVIEVIDNIYEKDYNNELLYIQTFYEKQFLKENKKIHYISFLLDGKEIKELPEKE